MVSKSETRGWLAGAKGKCPLAGRMTSPEPPPHPHHPYFSRSPKATKSRTGHVESSVLPSAGEQGLSEGCRDNRPIAFTGWNCRSFLGSFHYSAKIVGTPGSLPEV